MEGIDIVEQHIADRSLDLLKILLKDKTTGKYIRWATDNYSSNGVEYKPEEEMKPSLIIGNMTDVIQPRVSKSVEEQVRRTKKKAEVFTPTWIVNQQNNLVDEAWFGRPDIFNIAEGNTWKTNEEKIAFPDGKDWKKYVDSKRLEISCGEAPYLVSRYDAVTGETIPVKDRVGFLDRKLRVINENIENETEWDKWVIRAFQSIYGYEFQGDNVLLARENLLYTYWDNMVYKFGKDPSLMQQKKIANIVSWNIWQMDGITMTVPYSEVKSEFNQITLFDLYGWGNQEQEDNNEAIPCKIFDWRSNESIEFRSMMKEG